MDNKINRKARIKLFHLKVEKFETGVNNWELIKM